MDQHHELVLQFTVLIVTMIMIERHLREKISSRIGWRSVHTSKLQGADYVQELLNEREGQLGFNTHWVSIRRSSGSS